MVDRCEGRGMHHLCKPTPPYSPASPARLPASRLFPPKTNAGVLCACTCNHVVLCCAPCTNVLRCACTARVCPAGHCCRRRAPPKAHGGAPRAQRRPSTLTRVHASRVAYWSVTAHGRVVRTFLILGRGREACRGAKQGWVGVGFKGRGNRARGHTSTTQAAVRSATCARTCTGAAAVLAAATGRGMQARLGQCYSGLRPVRAATAPVAAGRRAGAAGRAVWCWPRSCRTWACTRCSIPTTTTTGGRAGAFASPFHPRPCCPACEAAGWPPAVPTPFQSQSLCCT